MGCANSKLDDLPAVALCRERCSFLEEAIHQRYVLAETHIAYVRSLKQVGHSLHNFITNEDYTTGHGGGGGSPLSPKLNLPPAEKGGGRGDSGGINIQEKMSSSAVKGHHSHSDSSGHIQFHSDPDEDDSGSLSGTFSGHSSSLHDYHHQHHLHEESPSYGDIDYGNFGNFPQMYGNFGNFPQMMSMDQGTLGGYNMNININNTHMHMNYMKTQAKPSIVYEQKPAQNYHVGESSTSSSSHYPYSSPYSYPGSNLGPGYGGGGGNYGYPPTYGSPSSRPPAGAGPSSSKLPPPSPPRASAWDFLNPFESYEKYYQQYNTPSPDSKELREEEGIPDLEDEEFQQEMVKKVHGDEKFVVGGGGKGGGGGGGVAEDEIGHIGAGSSDDAEPSLYQTRPSEDNEGVEYDVRVVEKKVVEERDEEPRNVARPHSRDAVDVAWEIEVQFDRASDSGSEFAKMLEVGRFPYQRKYASKVLHVVTPSLSEVSSQPFTSTSSESSSLTEKADPAYLDSYEDMAIRTRSLSATLQKLHLWEKKLYHEVKAEEKIRVIYDRKVRKLKHLDERGAEPHKVDATRTLIRNLSVKIGMAIHVVDKISVTINKIRDEELWPQINELIQGLTRMWKSMLECHHSQCQAIREAKILGPTSKKLGDAHLDATTQLEHELVNWIFRFSTWIGAQKGYVKALNSWLLKCLLYEPEETPDGIAPFSPGRMGAPPIFVICNQWFQALDRISEKEVIDSMRVFATSVLQLWEHGKLEIRQRMVANKDFETKVRNLDREDQKIQKKLQALDKKIIVVSGDANNHLDGNNHLVCGQALYQSDTSTGSLQGSLQRIFEALERFTAESVKAYEELFQRAEEERLARENERNS